MSDDERDVERVDGQVSSALAEVALRRTDASARLELVESLVDHPEYRHAVFRCELSSTSRPSRRVVVKRANRTGADAGREAAALRLLAASEETKSVVPELRDELSALYREELGRHIPAARDDAPFEIALADALAVWTGRVCASLTRLLERDRPRFRATERRRPVASLHAFAAHPAAQRTLPHTTAAAIALGEALQRLWADSLDPLPTFPAFAVANRSQGARGEGTHRTTER